MQRVDRRGKHRPGVSAQHDLVIGVRGRRHAVGDDQGHQEQDQHGQQGLRQGEALLVVQPVPSPTPGFAKRRTLCCIIASHHRLTPDLCAVLALSIQFHSLYGVVSVMFTL